MRLVFLLAFLPIISNPLQKDQFLLGQFPASFIRVSVLLRGGEKLGEVLLHLFQVVGVLNLLGRVGLFLLFLVGSLIVLLPVRQFGEFGLAVVLGLDVSVERGVAQVTLPAIA